MNCICCGEPLQIDTQPALMAGRADTLLYTCFNAVCVVEGCTFDSRDYADMNPADYCGGAR